MQAKNMRNPPKTKETGKKRQMKMKTSAERAL
jgi:hypothetical protein